ncbi:hypothetical protein CLAC_02160 [Corynebacterium lactis RW2-5]|uniref:Uncharacterized protein n=1 Tax=Corynebacterium lactis RW2-5 TaxID=1408189 RepID=A0A0K2H2Z2_9CORY|nr:hypothetical protein CLAC_02160 [Corynebacterium lactis RW2-5]
MQQPNVVLKFQVGDEACGGACLRAVLKPYDAGLESIDVVATNVQNEAINCGIPLAGDQHRAGGQRRSEVGLS